MELVAMILIFWMLSFKSTFSLFSFTFIKRLFSSSSLSAVKCEVHHAEYIMRNAGLDEIQAGVKTSRRNINNLKYADDTTLMAESKKELKSLLMNVKEESEKAGLKQHLKN